MAEYKEQNIYRIEGPATAKLFGIVTANIECGYKLLSLRTEPSTGELLHIIVELKRPDAS